MSGGRDGTRTRRRRLGTLSRTRWWWRVRVVALVVALALVPTTLVLGVLGSSYEHLRQQVADGSVTSVEVLGEAVEVPAEGYGRQEVRWRDGLVRRSAEVTVVSPGAVPEVSDGVPVVDRDVAADLRLLDPDLTVTEGRRPTTWSTVAGFELPGWVAVPLLSVWVGAVAALLGSPYTWRLDGWGWAWLMLLVPPVGAVAALLLSGPLPPLPRARRRRRGGLTGFLLAVLVGAVPGLLGWAALS